MTAVGKYTFKWKHGTRSLITDMTVRSETFEFTVYIEIVVCNIMSDEPLVRMMKDIPLQHVAAIVAEIKRERKRLIKESRKLVTGTISSKDIENHAWISLRAGAYLEDDYDK